MQVTWPITWLESNIKVHGDVDMTWTSDHMTHHVTKHVDGSCDPTHDPHMVTFFSKPHQMTWWCWHEQGASLVSSNNTHTLDNVLWQHEKQTTKKNKTKWLHDESGSQATGLTVRYGGYRVTWTVWRLQGYLDNNYGGYRVTWTIWRLQGYLDNMEATGLTVRYGGYRVTWTVWRLQGYLDSRVTWTVWRLQGYLDSMEATGLPGQ